jgi:hypothetical protein
MICDASGRVLAGRAPEHGEGVVIADVTPGRFAPAWRAPDRFWLHRRGALAAFTWWYQRLWGQRYYRDNVSGRHPASPSVAAAGARPTQVVAASGRSEAERAGGR